MAATLTKIVMCGVESVESSEIWWMKSFSRSLLQCDIHLHKRQPTNDQCSQLSAELGSEREQRPGHEREQRQQQPGQRRDQCDNQQQFGEEKAKSSQDRPRFQRKADDFNF